LTRAGLLGADELAAREQDRHKDKVADINFQGLAAAHGHPRRCIHCTQLPRTASTRASRIGSSGGGRCSARPRAGEAGQVRAGLSQTLLRITRCWTACPLTSALTTVRHAPSAQIYVRRLSLVRARGMTKRIKGAMCDMVRNRVAAAGLAARSDDGKGQQLASGDDNIVIA